MEVPRQSEGQTIVRLRTIPSLATLQLFTASFPRHPISRLNAELGAAFLQAFARDSTFLVACDANGNDVGFLIGGSTRALDEARVDFIKQHAWRIAAASANDHSLRRLVLPRLRPPRALSNPRFPDAQLRFIAVSPQVRGSGVGAQLVAEFESTLKAVDGYHTWTMAGPNGAEGFFCRLGFERDLALGEQLRLCKTLTR